LIAAEPKQSGDKPKQPVDGEEYEIKKSPPTHLRDLLGNPLAPFPKGQEKIELYLEREQSERSGSDTAVSSYIRQINDGFQRVGIPIIPAHIKTKNQLVNYMASNMSKAALNTVVLVAQAWYTMNVVVPQAVALFILGAAAAAGGIDLSRFLRQANHNTTPSKKDISIAGKPTNKPKFS
jgi:hypothetical protein